MAMPSRRACLAAAFGLLAVPWCHAGPHPMGWIDPPRALPGLEVTALDGRRLELATLLRGRVCALQLMFTGCSAVCPLEGAVFAQVQQQLRDAPAHWQLLSLGIDPLADDARALREWLKRFDARPARWSAASIAPAHLEALLAFVRGAATGVDRHVGAVYLFDREARFVYRSAELPPAESVVGLMREIDRLS